MLTCLQIADLCTDFEEGQLSWVTWAQFQVHLRMCPPCMEYVRQMRLTAEALGKMAPQEIPIENRAELSKIFQEWRNNSEEEDLPR